MARNNFDDLMKDIESSGQFWNQWDLDLARENPDFGRSLFTQKKRWYNATDDKEKNAANQAAEMLRRQYGSYYSGNEGADFTGIPKHETPKYEAPATSPVRPFVPPSASNPVGPYQPPKFDTQIKPTYAPTYTQYVSQYNQQIQDLLGQITGRKPFEYDPNKDVAYQAIAEGNRRNAATARKNALGDAAAMTGGQINSAAIAAGMLAENDANARTSDALPALRDAAWNMWMGDLNQKRQDLGQLMDLDRTAYGQHQDNYRHEFNKWQADYGVDRDTLEDQRLQEQQAYDRWRDQISDSRYTDEQAYDRWRDEIDDSRYTEQQAYDRWRDQVGDDRYATETEYKQAWQMAQLLASGGDFSGFAALGMTPQQIAQMEAAAARPARGGGDQEEEGEWLDLDLGDMSQGDIKDWVKDMLDNATSSRFNPKDVISGTSELTDDQKVVADAILDEYIKAGYTKTPGGKKKGR